MHGQQNIKFSGNDSNVILVHAFISRSVSAGTSAKKFMISTHFWTKNFNLFNYSSKFLYVFNSCKNFPEDGLEMIETYRGFDGFYIKIHIF